MNVVSLTSAQATVIFNGQKENKLMLLALMIHKIMFLDLTEQNLMLVSTDPNETPLCRRQDE
jgi:hypothetical protein